MNIIMVVSGILTDGGIARVNNLVLTSFIKKGYFVTVLSLHDSINDFIYHNISPEQCEFFGFKNNKLNFVKEVWSKLFTNSYEYIFIDHINIAFSIIPFVLLFRRKYIVWLHGIELFPPRPDLEGKVGLKFAWKRFASSDYTKSMVESRFPSYLVDSCELALSADQSPLLENKIKNTPKKPIFLEAVDQTVQEIGEHMILNVARMVSGERYKGQDSLIHSFEQIYHCDGDVQLVLVGRGDDRNRLIGIAKRLPEEIQQRIFMPGFVSEDILDQLYCSCYMFAMPSIGEGFGLVFLEAMSRGKPCIAGKLDASKFLVEDKINGILINNPHSTSEVADAVITLLKSPDLVATMGMNNLVKVNQNYTFEHFYRRFWQLLSA